jgi:hypothetical protein
MFDLSFVAKHNGLIKERNRKNHRYTENAKRRGKHFSKFEKAKFLAWDGEGLQVNGTQVYGLLANSNRDYIFNQDGLNTEDCLEFLLSDMYASDCIHVCFGASYDVNMMLRDVPEETLRQLHKGDGYVRWGIYEMEYRARKSFSIRKCKMEFRNGRWYQCYDEKKGFLYERSMTLWDVFGFFQKKFVGVLEEWTKGTEFEQTYLPIIDDIKEGKDKRGDFLIDELETFVVPYCLNECEALRDIMHILHSYLQEANLVLARWDGAGAIAAAALKFHNVKQHIRIGEHLDQEPYPNEVILASEFAYFGGWIEAFLFGDIRWKIYHYDLRSAYPSATVDLPSMTMGHWEAIEIGNMLPLQELIDELKDLPSYWITHIEWNNGPILGPCPFSWRNRKGNVTRPIQGRGWQWSPEVLAAYELFPNMKFSIDTVYYFVPDADNVHPFAFVDAAYKLRQKMKELGKGVEKVYKLYLNSIYGKLAQSLGYNEERDLKPPYHSLVYAGLITSKTRAKILYAVMQKPLSIVSIATDGIYSLAPLDLDIGPGLGQWEYTEHESMTVVQPGFYWYTTKGVEKHYYRGFNEGCIKRSDVIEAYINKQQTIDVSLTRFMTIGACIGLNKFDTWRQWITKTRVLDLSMQKSSKRIWKGDVLPGNDQIKLTRNRVFDPKFFIKYPHLMDSKKYEFDWDDIEHEGFEGMSAKSFIEEMFHMELSPAD